MFEPGFSLEDCILLARVTCDVTVTLPKDLMPVMGPEIKTYNGYKNPCRHVEGSDKRFNALMKAAGYDVKDLIYSWDEDGKSFNLNPHPDMPGDFWMLTLKGE